MQRSASRMVLVAWGCCVLCCVHYARSDVITYFRFEEGYGSSIADETTRMEAFYGEGNQNGGFSTDVPISIIPLTGANNAHSIYFSGGYVDFSTGIDLNLGTTFTIECFYKATEPGIVSTMFGLSPGAFIGMTLARSEGELYWAPQFQSQLEFFPATGVELDTWQHFALVKEPGEYSIYIDGQLQYNGALPEGTDGPYNFYGNNLTGDRTIGGNNGTWDGWIDEFRISDTALTPDQFLNAVPEPGTLGLLALGGLAAVSIRSYRRRNGMNNSK